jgi:hypothetical protein
LTYILFNSFKNPLRSSGNSVVLFFSKIPYKQLKRAGFMESIAQSHHFLLASPHNSCIASTAELIARYTLRVFHLRLRFERILAQWMQSDKSLESKAVLINVPIYFRRAIPLLDIPDISATYGVLIHIAGGEDMKLEEVAAAGERIVDKLPDTRRVVWGARVDRSLAGRVRIMAVLIGIISTFIEGKSQTPDISQQ